MNEDLSSVFEKLSSKIDKDSISPEMINSLMGMLNNSSDNSKEENSIPNNIDIDTIMKLKSVMDSMNNKDDPRSNLLLSLKPYLKEKRKSKLDKYIQFMNMAKIMENFSSMGGDKKNGLK